MPQIRLTARFLETLKPTGRRIDFFDADEPGLALRLSEHGRKTWCYLYHAQGSRRLRRLTLGTYPAVTLAAALYFFARLAHYIVYCLGIPGLRTAAWGVGFAATLMVAWAIFRG